MLRTSKILLAAISSVFISYTALAQETVPASQTQDTTTATDTQQAMIVLDGSGSMWGQMDGKTKIEIARSVIGDLLSDWNPDVHLGLVAYGHREKGQCNDIETVVPVGAVDSTSFLEAVNGITPVGKTPISDAVKTAAENLMYTEERATVILVSDGLETCDADPCALASELEKNGIDFTTHVIGFGLSKEETDQIACIATNTGGQVFQASNATELTEAMTKTVEAVSAPEPAPEPEPEASGPQALKLQGKLCETCDILDDKLYWKVLSSAQDINGKRDEIERSGAASPLFELPAGQYVVEGNYGKAFKTVEVEIKEGELTTEVINFDAGNLRVKSTATEGGEVINEALYYRVQEIQANLDGTKNEIDRSGSDQPLFLLPAGKYTIIAQHGQAFANQEVEVKAGELTEITLNLNVGYLRLSAIPTEGASPLTDALYYRVRSASTDLQGKRKEIDRSGGANPMFRLPAGDYQVEASHGKAVVTTDATVVAGSLTEETINLNVGYLALSAKSSETSPPIDSKIYYRIFDDETDLQGKRTQLDASGSATPLFRLPAGNYHVTAAHGKATVSADVTVEAGARLDETLVMNSGILQLSAATGPNDPPIASGIYYRIFTAETDIQGKRTQLEASGSGNPQFILPVGDYFVTAERNKQTFSTEVSIKAGELTSQTIIVE